MSFQELGLDSLLLRAIEASGFRLPTEVQRQVIPLALEGRDVMASAQTKRGAENLAGTLEADGHAAAALHGDMRQSARNRTVERLRRGKLRVLVATDVAARGLDIKDISHVINFDLPMVAQDYIHRIGRTGRAGVTGTAISLVGPGDGIKLGRIERLTAQKLDRQVIPGLEPTGPEPGRVNPSRYIGVRAGRADLPLPMP